MDRLGGRVADAWRERRSRRLTSGLRRRLGPASFPTRFAAALAVAFALLLAAAPVHAQTATTLVSNTGQSTTGSWSFQFHNLGQAFTTGTHSRGYNLTSVEVSFSGAPGSSLRARVHQGTPTGTAVATLTNPSSLTSGNLTFTAPANTLLSASTTYVLVLDSTTTGGLNLTSSDMEDSGGASGWSIANSASFKLRTSGSWNTDAKRL